MSNFGCFERNVVTVWLAKTSSAVSWRLKQDHFDPLMNLARLDIKLCRKIAHGNFVFKVTADNLGFLCAAKHSSGAGHRESFLESGLYQADSLNSISIRGKTGLLNLFVVLGCHSVKNSDKTIAGYD